MRVRPGAEFLLGGLAGVVLISLLTLLVWHFRPAETPSEQLARKASRADLVSRMQVALASSSEAERSAVLATTDEDSRAFADQARAAIGQIEAARAELAPLLAPAGLERERALLEAFSGDFARLRKVDEEILALAVKNTNVKAYALAYGPAAQALGELDAALARLAERRAGSAEGRPVLTLASRARIALLRIQVLLPPHIAEESNEKMDRIEASMAAEEREASQGLARLARIPALAGDPDLALAQARLAAFLELKARILALSRENTNVASLALSLDQQRKAMAVCAEALGALQQAVLEEPISGVTYGRQPAPTR